MNLVWMDLEMSGLNPDCDQILEIATTITDHELNLVANGPDNVIKQDQKLFASMDNWNQEHHTKSGLWQRVIDSNIELKAAEETILAFLKQYTEPKTSPLCGNSVWQDRRFIAKYMPQLDNFLHYRLVDVSTVKELIKNWYPSPNEHFVKRNKHRSFDDIKESIAELAYYRENFFRS